MKSHGESLLHCHVLSKDTSAFLSAHLTPDLFVGDESDQYGFITEHIEKYGALPDLETYKSYFNVGGHPPEPLEFYRNKVLRRFEHRLIAKALHDSAQLLNNNQAKEAVEHFHNTSIALKEAANTYSPPPPLFTVDYAKTCLYTLTDGPPVEHIFEGFMERKQVGILGGQGGLGKSRFKMQMLVSVACGMPLAVAWNVNYTGKVLGIFCEDSENSNRRRLKAITDTCTPEQREMVNKNLYIHSMAGKEMHLTAISHGRVVVTPLFDQLRAVLKTIPDLELLILDPVSMMNGGNENDASHMTTLFNLFTRLKEEFGCTVVVSHHVNKQSNRKDYEASMDDLRGSSAAACAARWQATMYKMSVKEAKDLAVSGDQRGFYNKLVITKFTESPPNVVGIPLWLKLDEHGVFTHVNFDAFAVKPNWMMQLAEHVMLDATKGIEYTMTSFATKFGGVTGKYEIGQKALKDLIQDCLDANILCEQPPKIKKKGVSVVLAAGPAITQDTSGEMLLDDDV